MPSRRINNFPESRRGLGHVTLTIFGSTVGYPSDSLASCYVCMRYSVTYRSIQHLQRVEEIILYRYVLPVSYHCLSLSYLLLGAVTCLGPYCTLSCGDHRACRGHDEQCHVMDLAAHLQGF